MSCWTGIESPKVARSKLCVVLFVATIFLGWMFMFGGFVLSVSETHDIKTDVDTYLASKGSLATNIMATLDLVNSSRTVNNSHIETSELADFDPDTALVTDEMLVVTQNVPSAYAAETMKLKHFFMNDEPAPNVENRTSIKQLGVGDSNNGKQLLLDKIVGEWHQVKTVGMAEFLKAEGENWIYQKMVAIAEPNFIITKESEKHYIQTIKVSIFPTESYPIILDEWYEYRDHFNRKMRCYATDNGKVVHSILRDGKAGPMSTFIELIDGQLYLTVVLDNQGVKSVRILDRVS